MAVTHHIEAPASRQLNLLRLFLHVCDLFPAASELLFRGGVDTLNN
jgi:hypothetical protein